MHNKYYRILIIEPFYGGSHKQFIDILIKHVDHTVIQLPAKKWPWRARCSALIVSEMIPNDISSDHNILLCSSVLSLCELLGLRPDLNKMKKIVYFHENQFIYPVQKIKDRDIQFAYNQITTCLSADLVVFNSEFNKNSLLENISKVIKIFPDFRPKSLKEKIDRKCKVIYFPMNFPKLPPNAAEKSEVLQIVWPHRWEFDKDPETLIHILLKLKDLRCKFKIHILGKSSQDVPQIFEKAKVELKDHIETFGYLDSIEEYHEILSRCHVALSTAQHEFFGVSMMESAYFGCLPIVPNGLVYPEIYPVNTRYNNAEECVKILKRYCDNPKKAIEDRCNLNLNFEKYSSKTVMPQFLDVFQSLYCE